MSTEKIKVAVLGSKGRMGSEACNAVAKSDDLELVAGIDVGDSLDLLVSSGAQVVVDFTHPDAVMGNLEFAISHGVSVVVGTTGFDAEKLAKIEGWLAAKPGVGALIAPNFGLGAVLMMQFAAKSWNFIIPTRLMRLLELQPERRR